MLHHNTFTVEYKFYVISKLAKDKAYGKYSETSIYKKKLRSVTECIRI